jgi:hypothetical protein
VASVAFTVVIWHVSESSTKSSQAISNMHKVLALSLVMSGNNFSTWSTGSCALAISHDILSSALSEPSPDRPGVSTSSNVQTFVLVLLFFTCHCVLHLLLLHLSSYFIAPACQLQISLGCGIRSRETMFKELELLIGPRGLAIPWLNPIS